MQVRFFFEYEDEWGEWSKLKLPSGWGVKNADAPPKKIASYLVKKYDEDINDVLDPIPPKILQAMGNENRGFAWFSEGGQGGGQSIIEWKE